MQQISLSPNNFAKHEMVIYQHTSTTKLTYRYVHNWWFGIDLAQSIAHDICDFAWVSGVCTDDFLTCQVVSQNVVDRILHTIPIKLKINSQGVGGTLRSTMTIAKQQELYRLDDLLCYMQQTNDAKHHLPRKPGTSFATCYRTFLRQNSDLPKWSYV